MSTLDLPIHRSGSQDRPELFDRRFLAEGHESSTLSGSSSAVSWGAIIAGAAGTAALAMLLLMLGVGLGLSSVSPWADQSETIGIATIAWLTAALLTTVVGTTVGSIAQTGASLAGGATSTGSVAAASAGAAGPSNGNSTLGPGPMEYFVESLFRGNANTSASQPADKAPADSSNSSTAGRTSPVPVAEVTRIFATSIRTGALPSDDLHYVAQLVAQRTGLSQQDAEKRVTDAYAKARAKPHNAETATQEAAVKARKASSYATLWMFIALQIGAFVASLAATYGGRRRDL